MPSILKNKKAIIRSFCIFFSSGLIYIEPTHSQQNEHDKTITDKMRIESGITLENTENYYAILEKSDGNWSTLQILESNKSPEINNPKIEVIRITKDLKRAEPDFSNYRDFRARNRSPNVELQNATRGSYTCNTAEEKTRPTYNPCDSSLTSSDLVVTGITNTLVTVATAGVYLMLPKTYTVSVDKNKVKNALISADTINNISIFIEKKRLTEYQNFYKSVQTRSEFKKLIQYIENSGYDPDKILPWATSKYNELLLIEYQNFYKSAKTSSEFKKLIQYIESSGYDPDKILPWATSRYNALLLTEAEERKKIAQKNEEQAKRAKIEFEEKEKRLQKDLIAWRRSIKIGDETYCGPVIETRGPMIKISIKVPLAGYANEIWIRTSESYPDWAAGCKNINGSISPTSNGVMSPTYDGGLILLH